MGFEGGPVAPVGRVQGGNDMIDFLDVGSLAQIFCDFLKNVSGFFPPIDSVLDVLVQL